MYEKMPQELKEQGAFCLWRYEKRNGDTTKVPYQISGLRGDSTNRAAFTDFASAASHRDSYAGIGIGVFGDICAIDIDHCVENGTLSDMAGDIIARMDSYENKSVVKVAHNLSFEAMFLYAMGIVVKAPCYDTIAAAQLTLKSKWEFRGCMTAV